MRPMLQRDSLKFINRHITNCYFAPIVSNVQIFVPERCVCACACDRWSIAGIRREMRAIFK